MPRPDDAAAPVAARTADDPTADDPTAERPVRGAGGGDDVRRMARGGGLNIVGAAFSQGSLFVIMLVLALGTSGADVGRYSMCYALLTILTLVALGGVRATMTRFVAMRLADADPGAVRGTIRLGMGVAVGGSIAVSLALALLAGRVADLLQEPGLREGILLVALAVSAATVQGAALAATQGWRSQRAFTLIGQILDPGLRLVLTVLAVLLGYGLMGALWALVVSSWTAALLAVVVLVRRLRRVERARPTYTPRPMASFAVVSWGSTLATTGLVWTDTLILGHLASAEDVGTYTVATRLVGLAIFVLNPINSAFVPSVARLHHLGDRAGVDVAYGAANRWIIRLSAPAFVLLLVFPDDLLGMFSGGYASAAAVTVVLAVGQLANAAAGPCGSVLNMTGHVRLSLADNVAALVLNVVLNLLLIPRLGVLGAALAWTVSLVLVNGVKWLQVRRLLGIRATGTGTGATLVAVLPAAALAVGLGLVLDGAAAVLLVAAPAVLLVYVAILLLRGLEPDDRAMLDQVLRRGGRGRRGRSSEASTV
ncbi:oligosaccharide flippase family protein [Arthrobacter sp. NEB 688]|uniref:oligosaccharide flippase family protein n=1 Tax=Arthrobacter sp. NEB 688 TaxID=904039 RepID=UPI0015640D6F|nr:oligosaccharide flippase family protein [Arthrobacter sp. NEB 688]QKE85799.1 oligosaccharide flippase family protein [Arthrobacter sp. NEB 688]